MQSTTFNIRTPGINDGARVWELIRDCPPLDLNSPYLYLILCLHFQDTCLVAENDSGMVGFVSAYRTPRQDNILFVWQIAVHESARGQGLGKTMLKRLLEQEGCKGVEYINYTVSPSNQASQSLFNSLAKDLKAEVKENVLFPKNCFPEGQDHEEEVLFQIGPIT